MSDREGRTLERQLRAEGRFADVVWEIVGMLEDPTEIALVIDRLSGKISVPSGNILTLLPEERPSVDPGATMAFPIMVPAFEGWQGRVLCLRVMLATTGAISWELRPHAPASGGGLDARHWKGGEYTMPFAIDPFELQQASVWDLVITNEDSHTVDVFFSLICRHQLTPCLRCDGWRMVGKDESLITGPGEESMPCPACQPEAHESYRLHEHLETIAARSGI